MSCVSIQMSHHEDMDHLLNQLDLDSALFHLRRIGFSAVLPSNTQSKHHMRRYREDADEREDIFIQRNDRNHFSVEHAFQGRIVLHPDTITSWDEWIIFFNPLTTRSTKEETKEKGGDQGDQTEHLMNAL
jgi:hypothetical protein